MRKWIRADCRENELSAIILDICIQLHRRYGPGLLESVYEELLCYELKKRGISFERQKAFPLIHEEIQLQIGFRSDVVVEKTVTVELKSVRELAESDFKQILTYLKITE